MSNSRQFLVPINYDMAQPVYPAEEMVRKRQYLMDDVTSPKQYQQLNAVTSADTMYTSSRRYADKLRR